MQRQLLRPRGYASVDRRSNLTRGLMNLWGCTDPNLIIRDSVVDLGSTNLVRTAWSITDAPGGGFYYVNTGDNTGSVNLPATAIMTTPVNEVSVAFRGHFLSFPNGQFSGGFGLVTAPGVAYTFTSPTDTADIAFGVGDVATSLDSAGYFSFPTDRFYTFIGRWSANNFVSIHVYDDDGILAISDTQGAGAGPIGFDGSPFLWFIGMQGTFDYGAVWKRALTPAEMYVLAKTRNVLFAQPAQKYTYLVTGVNTSYKVNASSSAKLVRRVNLKAKTVAEASTKKALKAVRPAPKKATEATSPNFKSGKSFRNGFVVEIGVAKLSRRVNLKTKSTSQSSRVHWGFSNRNAATPSARHSVYGYKQPSVASSGHTVKKLLKTTSVTSTIFVPLKHFAPVVPQVPLGPPVGSQEWFALRIRDELPPWFASPDTSPVLTSLLQGPAYVGATLFNLQDYAALQTRIGTASGQWLDMISRDYLGINVQRFPGQSDVAFRARITAEVIRERATRSALFNAVQTLTGRAPVVFEPWRPLDTGAYNTGTLGYNTTGKYGSLIYHAQVFIVAFRSSSAGSAEPNLAGYGDGVAVYTTNSGQNYYGGAPTQLGVSDADIYGVIARTMPAGSIAWVALQ